MSMQAMIAKRLLKTWLKNVEVLPGELRPALMMYEEDGEIFLVSLTLKVNEQGKLEVARVLQNINIDDAV
jgi:hypothetical protein